MARKGISLHEIASEIPGVLTVIGGDVLITEVTHDSRQVQQGTLFVAVAGEHFDGHAFVRSAVNLGASGILVESEQPRAPSQIVVEDSRLAMAPAARAVFGRPDAAMWMAGVTGTNGKTTVSHMVESIFRTTRVPVGMIGTLGARVDGVPLATARTTPEATDLQRMLAAMRDHGVERVMMEVSSHAIALHRSDGIFFDVAAFTNLSHDHLDFHGDMETYFGVKARLFRPEVAASSVVSIDDPWGVRLAASLEIPLVSVSTVGDADISAANIVLSSEGATFDLRTPVGETAIGLPLAGSFNISNALVAAGIALGAGVNLVTIVEGLHDLGPIAGRMEIIPHSGPFTVVVDYAHTPDAIEVVLRAVQPTTQGRVIAVIGAGGDRDREKRVPMGSAAALSSDVTIITTDNPRSEDPAVIATEVKRGAEITSGAVVMTIIDRAHAIREAIEMAVEGDTVMILGKGHEQGQDIGTEVLAFDDREEAVAALTASGWVDS